MQNEHTSLDQDRFLASMREQFPEVPAEVAQKLPELMSQGCPSYFAEPATGEMAA